MQLFQTFQKYLQDARLACTRAAGEDAEASIVESLECQCFFSLSTLLDFFRQVLATLAKFGFEDFFPVPIVLRGSVGSSDHPVQPATKLGLQI